VRFRVKATVFSSGGKELGQRCDCGTYLSGGIDSVDHCCGNPEDPRLMSFTGGFDLSSVSGLEASFDEREPAEFMASRFGTEHYEMVMHSGDMAWVMPKLIWHLEDLRVGMCWQNYYIARLASKFVKVVLSGTGGDENFAGYPWRYLLAFDRELGAIGTTEAYYRDWQRLIADENKPRFFDARILRQVDERYCRQIFSEFLRKAVGPNPLTSPLRRASILSSRRFFTVSLWSKISSPWLIRWRREFPSWIMTSCLLRQRSPANINSPWERNFQGGRKYGRRKDQVLRSIELRKVHLTPGHEGDRSG